MTGISEILMNSMAEQTAVGAAKDVIEFEEAFNNHHRVVYRTARSVLRDDGLAEDVAQEVFIRLENNLGSVTSEEMLRQWLIRVMLNLGRTTRRGNSRENTRDENYVKLSDGNVVDSVEKEFEQKEELSDMNRALTRVKEPLRSCLVLKQQGFSYREIAESLSLNETSIGTYVARARAEFMRYYGKSGGSAQIGNGNA